MKPATSKLNPKSTQIRFAQHYMGKEVPGFTDNFVDISPAQRRRMCSDTPMRVALGTSWKQPFNRP